MKADSHPKIFVMLFMFICGRAKMRTRNVIGPLGPTRTRRPGNILSLLRLALLMQQSAQKVAGVLAILLAELRISSNHGPACGRNKKWMVFMVFVGLQTQVKHAEELPHVCPNSLKIISSRRCRLPTTRLWPLVSNSTSQHPCSS